MSSAIKIVKRKDREVVVVSDGAVSLSVEQGGRREIVRTVKTWIIESRERRQAEAKLSFQFIRGSTASFASETARTAQSFLLLIVAGLILLGGHETQAQAPATSAADSLTLNE